MDVRVFGLSSLECSSLCIAPQYHQPFLQQPASGRRNVKLHDRLFFLTQLKGSRVWHVWVCTSVHVDMHADARNIVGCCISGTVLLVF